MPASARALWYGVTAFVGAALLFAVEPMVGKMLLPSLGGAPAVWVTCLVFFQAALLAGYAWAHALSRWPLWLQVVAHGLLVAAGLAMLPLRAPTGAPDPGQALPAIWLLSRLTASVGLPFVALSATGPLIQSWLAAAPAATAPDPYFLFAASNAGSLLALLAYPVAVEPLLALRAQCGAWLQGYRLLAVLLAGCAFSAMSARAGSGAPAVGRPAQSDGAPAGADSHWRWFALALVPSALVCSVTTFVTTDVAPVPLLWVLPLALYLASFVVPFARLSREAHRRVHDGALRALPAALLALAFSLAVGADRLLWLVVLLHLAAFFVVALACHGELARTRPPPHRLTRFYLILSAGGAAGGALVALVAPLVFPAVWEYPLVLLAVGALRAGLPSHTLLAEGSHQGSDDHETAGEDFEELARAEGFGVRRGPLATRARRVVRAVGMPLLTLLLLVAALRLLASAEDIVRVFVVAQIATAACVVAWTWRRRPWRFASMLAAILAAPALATFGPGMLFVGRSFFAVHRVANDAAQHRHLYAQGTTIHGLQSTLPERARVAGAYFHRSGPAGDVLGRIGPSRVGLVGLGVASLAAYADTGARFTFYEIDPVVARIAEDPRLFTFLRDARGRGAQVDVVLGDARIRLAEVPDAALDVLVLDAYSSDVVPTHLLTREAFALYVRKLAPGGFVLMNVSNRYLDLGRVVGAVAADAGLSALTRLDEATSEEDRRAAREDGKAPSRWIVVARRASDLDPLELSSSWTPLVAGDAREASRRSAMRPWTDDYVNVVGCLRF
jgi:hypothetical protein